MKHQPGLDVLRAACVLLVFSTHFSSFAMPGLTIFAAGSFGVVGFFVLSSYLLTRIFFAERETYRNPGSVVGNYFVRRILRIWPLYFALVGFVALVEIDLQGHVSSPWLGVFGYNWVSASQPSQYLSHFWSMCVEEQLYLIIPAVVYLSFRTRNSILAILTVVAIATRIWVSFAFPYPAVWNFTTSHLDSFALGVLLGSLDSAQGERWRDFRDRITTSRLISVGILAAGTLLITASILDAGFVFGSAAASWTYLLAALCFGWLLLRVTPLGRNSDVRQPAQLWGWIGARSYGLYVFHWPIIVLAGLAVGALGEATRLPLFFAALATTFVVAWLSYRWFEGPLLRLKKRFRPRPERAAS